MKISCTECGAVLDLFSCLDDADGRLFVDELKELPPVLIKPFLSYLRLFKPAKQAIKWSRMLRLTRELAPIIKSAQITRNGIVYAVPVDHWRQEFLRLADRPATLQLPLKDHGYLLQVLANQAEKAAATVERAGEFSKRNRGRDGSTGAPVAVAQFTAPSPKKERSTPPPDWKSQVFKRGDNSDDSSTD